MSLNPDSIWHKHPLMLKLEKVMPKKPESTWKTGGRMLYRVSYEPIRYSAESFVHYLDKDLPIDGKELRDVLWVFGELLCGDMEKMVNVYMRHAEDLIALQTNPIYIVKEKI